MTDYNKWNEACELTVQQQVQIKELQIENKILTLEKATLDAKLRELEYKLEVTNKKNIAYKMIEELYSNKE